MHVSQATILQQQPRFLWFLTLLFGSMVMLAHWFKPRPVEVLNISTDAGILIFPLTFLLIGLITEVYGYKRARHTIWVGFLFYLLVITYSQISIYLPSPDYATANNELFKSVYTINARMIIVSLIGYLLAEFLNVSVIQKLKAICKSKFVNLRFMAAALVTACAYNFIFWLSGVYAINNHGELWSLILTVCFVQILIQFSGIPLVLYLAYQFKQAEEIKT